MPRIIFKCPYLRSGAKRSVAHRKNYVTYMATRDGVDPMQKIMEKKVAMGHKADDYEVQNMTYGNQ